MNDQLAKSIESIVDGIFKKKEEAEMKKETEAALTQAASTITQLTESLEAKETEHQAAVSTLQATIASLETQVNQMADEKKTLEDAKAGFDKEKEDLVKRAEAAEKELENIKKDQVATARMTSLKTDGVASTNVESQQAKVREMSDEEFASYKEELVAIKDSIIKQLESSANLEDEEAKKAQASADAEAAIKEAELAKVLEVRLSTLKEAGAEVTDAAEIEKIKAMDDAAFASFKDELLASQSSDSGDVIDPMKAIASALNMEVKPNEDMINKYRALGAALAENINTKKKR